MKTAACIFLGSLLLQSADRREQFVSTRVIGYSQVKQWYTHFEKRVDNGRWELLWNGGAGVDKWSNPDYKGWSNRIVSPTSRRSGNPDRVVLSVSGPFGTNVNMWVRKIQESVKNIRDKYPNVRRIVLLPVVGGHDHHECPRPKGGGGSVRAARQHPYIDKAIAKVVATDPKRQVVAGISPEVPDCKGFRDNVGHLSREAEAPVGKAVADYFNGRKR